MCDRSGNTHISYFRLRRILVQALCCSIIPCMTDSPCTGNFLNRSALRQAALDINMNNVKYREQQCLFPDITFTCNGFITKWIVGGTTDNTKSLEPELQIWRNTEGTSYTKETAELHCSRTEKYYSLCINCITHNTSTMLCVS